MHFNVPHKTSPSHAVGRVKTALNQNRGAIMHHAKITKEEWEGNTLNFAIEIQGKPVTGTLAVTETEFVFDATLPLLWRLFEGKLEKEIQKQVQSMA